MNVNDATTAGPLASPQACKPSERRESGLACRRQLSEEEQERLDQLKDMLMDLLTEAEGRPNEEQRSRVRAIEKEIAKISGEKPHTSLAASTAKLPLQKKDDETSDPGQSASADALLQAMIRGKTLPHSPELPGPGSLTSALQAAESYLAVARNTTPASGAQSAALGHTQPGAPAHSPGYVTGGPDALGEKASTPLLHSLNLHA